MDVFPMSGPIELSAYMEKTDRTLDHYILSGQYESERENVSE